MSDLFFKSNKRIVLEGTEWTIVSTVMEVAEAPPTWTARGSLLRGPMSINVTLQLTTPLTTFTSVEVAREVIRRKFSPEEPT